MRLARRRRSRVFISVVSMIDIMMILLIFFMVTSSYLDLKMLPMVDRASEASGATGAAREQATLLIRLTPEGAFRVRGQTLDLSELKLHLEGALSGEPQTSVLVLPSGRAGVQTLVNLMDAATDAGVTKIQVLRLEQAP